MTVSKAEQFREQTGQEQVADNGKPMVHLENIVLEFDNNRVLDGINLDVYRNEIVAVVGPSGTGKSTLAKIIAGLLIPDDGVVELQSDKIGLAFQSGALFSSFTVADNLALVLRKTTDLRPQEIQKRVQEALQTVGLEESADEFPSKISGGMQKRVGIARALVIEPDIMVYDEPSAGLDPMLAAKLEKDLRQINEERGMATILISHELPSIATMADRVYLLYEGKFVFEGTVDEFMHSNDPHAKQFRTRREHGPIDV
jgi:phospholipid/cholesterol/gamma-HCH transport system ATP-binding protein